ncbi:MAG: InlB B-repeat-containing protein [Fibrobacter sp.]|nr:InlB B-repeat-containing protein [Fibrobacter sp.]
MNCLKMGRLVFGAILLVTGQALAIDAWVDFASKKAPADTVIQSKSYYKIASAADLAWLLKQSDLDNLDTNIGINAILTSDIDLSGKLWTPIAPGTGETRFTGIFDGNGHTIQNMYIKGTEIVSLYQKKEFTNYHKYIQNLGLFGTLGPGSYVKNLALLDVQIEASHNKGEGGGADQISIGALVGWEANSGGKVENVMTSGTIIVSGKGQGVGGIVGAVGSVTLKNCLSQVQLIASGNNSYLGGLIGVSKQKSTIISCVYDGPEIVNTGDSCLSAALVGYTKSGTTVPTNVFFDQDVTSDTAHGTGVQELNTAEVTCLLNSGTWSDGTCSGETSNAWSVGMERISLFGSDGYQVTFDANGGTFAPSAKTYKTVIAGAAITTDEIGTPTRDGYFFAGWAYDSKASDAEELGNATANVTVYAVWDAGYTVNFHAEPGLFSDGEGIKSVKVPTKGAISVEGFDALTVYEDVGQVKYYFTGWAYDPNSAVDDTLNLASIEIDAQKKTLDLYAVWTEEPTYTVTFNSNGHAFPNVQSAVVTSTTEIQNPTLDAANGYELEGWYTDGEFSEGSVYTFGGTTEESFTLYANWSLVTYNITYNLNGGKNANNPDSYTVESENIVLQDPTRDGYTFAGWFYDKEFTNSATQISTGSSGNVTLYAKWTEVTYSIHYLAGKDAYGTVAPDTKSYGKSIKIKDSTDAFTREGYVITGWATSDGGQKKYDLGATYKTNADLILYPVWKVDPNSIPKVKARKMLQNRSNAWYDLHGRKFGTKPTVQGTFIHNGKRTIVK